MAGADVQAGMGEQSNLPWFRQVSKEQWKAFLATFFGWMLDGFDFTVMTFILIDIQNSFTVDAALAGALGTVTLLFRLVGGLGAGIAADRWGRKLPLLLSILWFSLFAFLSGFSTSYAMLFGFRALFGIGMGDEWAAGMPLVLEHWPVRFRGIASGLLQGGWQWGTFFQRSSSVTSIRCSAACPIRSATSPARRWGGASCSGPPSCPPFWCSGSEPELPRARSGWHASVTSSTRSRA